MYNVSEIGNKCNHAFISVIGTLEMKFVQLQHFKFVKNSNFC